MPSNIFQRAVAALAGCCLALLLAVQVSAATTGDCRNHVYDSRVGSLQVSPESNQYFPPIIILGGIDRIKVSFDVLDPDFQYLRYSIVHCDANWQPSRLVASEYTSGFNEADVEEHQFSAGTFAHYVHYDFTLPNENVDILKSGNYVVRVYERDDPDHVLFQSRFSVCENVVSVRPEVTSRTDVDYNQGHQQVSFEAEGKNYRIANPYEELVAVVSQNNRTDNEAVVTKPMMVSGSVITFDHDRKLIFAAGNEYRRIEAVSVNSMNMGVNEIRYIDPYYHVTLREDEPRAEASYLYDKTQYGHFTIRNMDSDNSDSEADYMVFHFDLNTAGPLEGGNIYLQGEFTQGLPLRRALMRYNAASGHYLCDMLLKQGAYNYQYLWVPSGKGTGETGMIEGDKYQTVNEYLVKLYHRPMGERYDHFVGFGIVHSGK